MKCPRCGNELNASKGPCTRCGFVIHMTGPIGPEDRSSNFLQSNDVHSRGLRPVQPPSPPGGMPPMKEPSSGMQPTRATQSSGGISPVKRPSDKDAFSLKFPSTDALTLDRHSQTPQTPSQSQPGKNRLITVPLSNDGPLTPVQQPLATSARSAASSSTHFGSNSSSVSVRSLLPGVLLRGGRYRLREQRERQDWAPGVFEAMWVAQDAQRGAAQVTICELVVPDNASVAMQSSLRNAAKALVSIGRHSRIPTLWDAFNDQERSFFVIEPVEGESLITRIRNSGRTLSEQDVIECCLQMTEVLELLAQQSPPVVHGLIRPEHIVIGRNGSQYILTNFSVVLASGTAQLIAGVERSRISPYTAPELARGVIDLRSDLYSLMATAYFALTGSVPKVVNGSIPQVQKVSSNISPQLDAVIMKGLRQVAGQRYQRPSELRQDLLAMRSSSSTLIARNTTFASGNVGLVDRNMQRSAPSIQAVPDSVAQALPILLTSTNEVEENTVLPRPEELPRIPQSNDWRNAAIWFGAILLCLVILVIVARVLTHT